MLNDYPGYIIIKKYSAKTLWHDCKEDVRDFVEEQCKEQFVQAKSKTCTFGDLELTVWRAVYHETWPKVFRVTVIGTEINKVIVELETQIQERRKL